MKLTKYIFFISILSIIAGPFGEIPLMMENIKLYISDILVSALWLTIILNNKVNLYKIIKRDRITQFFFIVVIIGFLSNIFSPLDLNLDERIISLLYLVRFFSYFSIYLAAVILIKNKQINDNEVIKWIKISVLILAIIGWMQYFLYPDLRNLFYLGWDPHYKRILATYFDPNYLGLVLVFTLILSITASKLSSYNKLEALFIIVTLAFTYSRSSFLSAIIVVAVYSIIKRKLFLVFVSFFILILAILLLPRPGGEGVKLERFFSITKRLESWKQGVIIFSRYPLLGVGFNSLRYAKIKYFPELKEFKSSHSGAGVENSYIFIASTLGIIGLAFYFLLLYQLFKYTSISSKLIWLAVLVHSFFLNSLFYPWVMLFLWCITGVKRIKIK